MSFPYKLNAELTQSATYINHYPENPRGGGGGWKKGELRELCEEHMKERDLAVDHTGRWGKADLRSFHLCLNVTNARGK